MDLSTTNQGFYDSSFTISFYESSGNRWSWGMIRSVDLRKGRKNLGNFGIVVQYYENSFSNLQRLDMFVVDQC